MARKQHAGGASRTVTVGSIASSGGGTVVIADPTGWPDGSIGKFNVTIDGGLSSEEKIEIDSRSGTTLSFSSGGRGGDGTVATSHSPGATIWHSLWAEEVDEANAHINSVAVAHTAAQVSFAPTGNIASNTVQAALAELDTETDSRLDALEAADTALDARVDALEALPSDVLSLTASTAANTSGSTMVFTWNTEVSDPSGFIAAPSDTITVPGGLGGLYVIVLKTTGDAVLNYPIILVNDGSNNSHVGGVRADARNNTTATLRLAAGNTIKGLTHNTSGSTDNRGAALTLHRISA